MRHNGLTRIMVMGSWYNEDNGVNSGSGISGNDFMSFVSNRLLRSLKSGKVNEIVERIRTPIFLELYYWRSADGYEENA